MNIGYGRKVLTDNASVSVSTSKSNMNSNGITYQNGLFVNVDEEHNNTKNMTLSGFNQVGGKVTGNIQNLTIESKQNTSSTTGSTKGGSIGFAPNGMPTSISANYSQTNGERKYVDTPTTFIIGEGSNLKVGKVDNTASAIGTTENGKLSIDEYIGHNLENKDNTTIKGGSLSLSPNSNVISGVGINYANKDLESVTRNTVIGNVEIGKTSGDEINKDLDTMTEVTKDEDTKTNVFIESQTIKYALNPEAFKEDIQKAKNEIADIGNVVENTINPKGLDKRNVLENLRAQRGGTTLYNVVGSRAEALDKAFKDGIINKEEYKEAVREVIKGYGKDIGVEYEVVYLDEDTMPKDAKGSTGAAFINKETGKMLIPIDVSKIEDTGSLWGVIAEEISHIQDGLAGRQDKKVTNDISNKEKGLESLGRPINDYVKNKLGEDNNSKIKLSTDGIDLTNVNVGEKIGDVELIRRGINGYNEYNEAVKDIELSIEAIKDKNKEYLEVAERIGKDGLLNEMSKEYDELNISEVSKKMFVVYGGSDEIRKLYLQKEKNSKGEIVDMLILDDFIPKDMPDLWAAPQISRELRKIRKYWKKELSTKDSVTISYQNRVKDETVAYPNFTQKSSSKFYALGRTKLYQSTYGNIKRLENGKYDVAITVIFQYVDRFEDAKNINLFSNDGKNKNKEFKGGKGFSIKTKPKPVTIVK